MYNTINIFKVKEKKVNGSVGQYFYLEEMQKNSSSKKTCIFKAVNCSNVCSNAKFMLSQNF